MNFKDGASCQLTANTNEAEFRVAFGSKGSLVILLRDQYQENAVTDALGWGENQNYRAALFIDAQAPIPVRGTSSVGAHTPYSAFKHRPKCNIYGDTYWDCDW